MHAANARRSPLGLDIAVGAFIAVWTLVALFPLLWVAVMSFKMPIDAFAINPLAVILGPATRAGAGGLSVLDLALGLPVLIGLYQGASRAIPILARMVVRRGLVALGWLGATLVVGLAVLVTAILIMPPALAAIDTVVSSIPGLSVLAAPVVGVTLEAYRAVWVGHGFTRNFLNSLVVTTGVVVISLSVGTLAGYALSRRKRGLAFWLLMAALIFRALPQSVLVAGYLPPFIDSRAILMPLWDAPVLGAVLHLFADAPPTLYGQPLAVILVLVSINQPFTIWMLRSFFETIPAELDEAARVDGCSHFEAFRRVIMPVMWPGVVTTGLFSFLLAYNDYLVCAMLLDAQSQTMVPAITQYFNRETTSTDQIQAIAAAVSITAPLFVLVMIFQRQIVSGLTAGAVKG